MSKQGICSRCGEDKDGLDEYNTCLDCVSDELTDDLCDGEVFL